MSDNEIATRPTTEIVGKLSLLSLGSPAAALADDNINKATMGAIFGRASGIVRRTKKNEATGMEEKLKGFKGSFVAVPHDARRPEVKSSVLYLPEGLSGALMDRLEEAEKDGELITIDIALEAFVQRAKNPAGYSWGARPLIEEAEQVADDPIALIRQKAMKALPAPDSDQPEASPAPEKETVDAKHKKA